MRISAIGTIEVGALQCFDFEYIVIHLVIVTGRSLSSRSLYTLPLSHIVNSKL
jgi:hypothetical protein